MPKKHASVSIPVTLAKQIDEWRESPAANPDPTRKARSRADALAHLAALGLKAAKGGQ